MAARRETILIDPDLSKFIFHLLSNAKEEQKKELNEVELRVLLSDRTMKSFADNASLDQKLNMLHKMGMSYAFVLHKAGEDMSYLKDIHLQHRSVEKRLEIMKEMKKGNVFCFGSREIMFSLQMCSNNSHHKSFLFDHRHKKLQDTAKKIQKVSITDQSTDVMDSYATLAKFATSNFSLNDKAEAFFKVPIHHLKIMVALFPYRNTFTSRSKLIDLISAKENVTGLSRICGIMITKHLLQRPMRVHNQLEEYHSYMLTEQGLEIVIKYLKWISDGAE